MNKLNKLGLTALAGALAATSAQAIEMSVSGGASINFATSDSTEVTGNKMSMGDSLTFSGSGETDQGWTVTAKIEVDGGTYDDRSVTIDMGDSGTVHVQDSGAQGTGSDLVGAAYGSASYSLVSASTTGKHVMDGLDSGAGTVNLGYTTTVAGVSIGLGYTPGGTGGKGSSTAVSLKYSDLVDGLTLAAGMSDRNTSAANGTDEMSLSASYVVGGATIGYTDFSSDDDTASGTDYDSRHYGISFAVNDDLTISYDKSISDKSNAAVDEETNSIQASYTMGSMTIKGHISKADNEQFSSGAEDEAKAIDVSWSF
tara:strand:+ start:715 stop:1653 length:939 start_codon:yes stop_codon:yes gene_type:complete